MAGSFGGVTCDFVKDLPAGATQRGEVFYLPGIDYAGVHAHGLGGNWTCRLIRFGTTSTITAWLSAIKAKVLLSITIVDNRGASVARCVPVEVGNPQISPGGISFQRCEVQVNGVYG
jgi:hypothetical protein